MHRSLAKQDVLAAHVISDKGNAYILHIRGKSIRISLQETVFIETDGKNVQSSAALKL
jgi:hypothetical protein